MDISSRYLRIALSVLVTLACVYLLGMLRGFLQDLWQVIYVVLLPFLISLVIAYALQPIVELLVRRRVPRGMAIMIIYLAFVLLVAVAVLQAIPAVTRQFVQLTQHFPTLVQQVDHWIGVVSSHKKYLPDAVRKGVESALTKAEQGLAGSVSNLFAMLTSTVSAIFVIFVVPFLVFYMLKDGRAIGRGVLRAIPARYRPDVKTLLLTVDETLGTYVRSQLLVMLVVGVLTYAGFLVIRLPYALLFASFLAVVDMIPYIGPFIGALPALIMGLSISPQMALKVLIVNIVVQQLEGNLISPQIMGKTLHMHPMAIVAALLIGGEVGGILGLVCAVPILAVLKVVVSTWKELRKPQA
ncbi:AI-2E family transporter [Alicyclobacillus ferrooxydans]|nr:AI-2E family transporter [Alicyclobacillus ferrooxydans]